MTQAAHAVSLPTLAHPLGSAGLRAHSLPQSAKRQPMATSPKKYAQHRAVFEGCLGVVGGLLRGGGCERGWDSLDAVVCGQTTAIDD